MTSAQDHLRSIRSNWRHETPTYAALTAAADRIDELETALRDIGASDDDGWLDRMDMQKIARRALEGES